MKTFTNLWKSKKLFLAAALLCGGMTNAWADELTVYDGTNKNSYIPIYGGYSEAALKEEFIIPSTEISAMAGATIKGIKFYAETNNTTAKPTYGTDSAPIQVFLKEVEANTYSSTATFIGTDDATTVYEGTLVVSSNEMVITFTQNYTYNGGNLLIGLYKEAGGTYLSNSFYGISQADYTAAYKYNSTELSYITTGTGARFIPKTTFTYDLNVEGPALSIYDSSTKIASGYSYNFGLASSSDTKTFTLKNPGTEAVTLSIAATNGFGVTPSSTTIAAKGEETLTVTMADATATGTITITPAGTGVESFTLNVSGTVRDANKIYEYGFTALPTDWTTNGTWYYSEANGAYTTVWYLSSNARLITPQLSIAEGETFYVEAKGYSTSNTSYQHLQMQYSADGTTWTNFDSEPTLDPSNWNTFSFTGAPAGKYYIAINASQADIRMFYGGELPNEPKMVVTQPTSLDFGVIAEATTKTFTIANTGKVALEGINVVSSNSTVFTITNAPATLAAGASQDVTITMAATNTGALSSDITVSATGMDDVTFTVTGTVLPEGLTVVDFEDNAVPANWTNASWTFDNGIATGKSSSAYLTTPKLIFAEGDLVVLKAKRYDSDTSDYLTVQGSSDNGSTWTAYSKKLQSADGLTYPDFGTIVLTDIPATVNKLRFVGYYSEIDEIWGLNYAPVLTVTQNETAVTSPASFDFGECAADATVTYNLVNVGAGTINITNVAITGEGDAAYTTNWTESTAVPFDLVITRSYDAERTAAAEAVVTVTTTEGDFVINVTGTDKAANAPELAVTLAGETVTTEAAVDFGKQLQAAPEAKTFTVTNSGTGTLTGTIATSDDSKFTVSKTSFSLGAAESMTFDVALVYDTNYGAKAATITITPANAGLEAVLINATASTLDPEAWTEDFAAGTLPSGWTQGTWTIGAFTYYENTTTMALAPSSATAGTIITPRLSAKAGDVLTWDAYFNWYDEAMTVEYSDDDQTTWTKIYDAYKAQEDFGSTRYTHKEMSFTAPADGSYYLRFTSTYQNGIDNICGFKLDLPKHIMAITASNIPTSGSYSPSMKATKPFDATVTVTESRGVDEKNVIAKLYMGEDVIGTSETVTVEANSTKVITITATPTAAATEGAEMHIEVTYDGGTLNTEAVTRYVAEFKKLELTEAEAKDIETGYSAVYDQVTLTRSFAQGWNTFVAPIATAVTEFGEGAKFYEFKSYEDGALNFSLVTSASLTVATPYIVYVPEAISEKVFTWDEPVIYSSYVGADNIKATKDGVTFQGTYAPVAAGGLTGNYGVTPAGKIQKAGSSASIKGFRAYFTGITSEARLAFTDESTGITTVITAGELTDGKAFDLQGRNVQNLKKGGLYIINGKKQVVK